MSNALSVKPQKLARAPANKRAKLSRKCVCVFARPLFQFDCSFECSTRERARAAKAINYFLCEPMFGHWPGLTKHQTHKWYDPLSHSSLSPHCTALGPKTTTQLTERERSQRKVADKWAPNFVNEGEIKVKERTNERIHFLFRAFALPLKRGGSAPKAAAAAAAPMS